MAVRDIRAYLLGLVFSISVEPIMLVYMITLYYYVPAVNSLYLYKICRNTYGYNVSLCENLVASKWDNRTKDAEDIVSTETSKWYFYQTVVFVVPSVVVSWLLGAYADRKGRLLPIILPYIGQVASCVLYMVLAKIETVPVGYMLIGPVLTGLSGGFAAVTMGCYSHIATVSSPENRTIRITILQGCMSVGIIIGSFTSGFILDQEIDPVPGWEHAYIVIIALCAVIVLYTFLRLGCFAAPRNELMEERTPHIRCDGLAVFKTVCASFPSVLQLCLATILLLYVTGVGKFDVLYQYTQRMNLNRSLYGIYQGLDAAVGAIAGVVATVLLKKILHLNDTTLAIIGMVSSIICVICIGFSGTAVDAKSTAFVALWWFSPFAGMFSIIAATSMRSIASSLTSLNDQSKLFAFISSGDAFLQLCTAALYNYVLWPATEKNLPGLCFFVTAIITAIALGMTCVIRMQLSRNQEHDPLIAEEIEPVDG